jgi:thiol-disulfide isomerase/thioredoxin
MHSSNDDGSELYIYAALAIVVALLATILGCGGSDTASGVRSEGYFVGYVAAAEHRLRAPVKKKIDRGPPAEVYGAAPDPVEYQEARRRFYDEKKPMFIVIHAEWCGPCNTMLSRSIPRVKNLDRVSYVLVDVDEEPEVKKKLTDEQRVPQIILFYYDKEGVAQKQSVVGAKSAEEIEGLIDAHVPEVSR